MSDGYRNVIKMVLDIATRMCILNPYLKGDALKMTPGIVIIDEIDLSLHPTWQKRIIGILKEQFPRIQLYVLRILLLLFNLWMRESLLLWISH